MTTDPWSDSAPYERFMGRWSRQMAPLFLDWLEPATDLHWLEVGCGTGALTGLIARRAGPRSLLAVDPSEAFVAQAAQAVGTSEHVRFQVAHAAALPAEDATFDLVVSALALNFFPGPEASLREMRRVVRPGGTVAAYVWDYAGGMEMLRVFWDTAVALNPAARSLDEAVRFPLCRPAALQAAFAAAGLKDVEVSSLVTPTRFADFADFWQPFLGGVGPAPAYVASLDDDGRAGVEAALRAALPAAPDGSILLTARAWAVRGLRGAQGD